MSVTTIVAIYGALLSTVAVLWNIIVHVMKRGRLRVVCYIGHIFEPDGQADEAPLLVYSVTNVGKEPVFVTHIGGKRKGDEGFLFAYENFPRSLQPGEYFTEYINDLSVLDETLECLWAWDSIGRVYRVKRKVLKKLVRRKAELDGEGHRGRGLPADSEATLRHGTPEDSVAEEEAKG